MSTLKVNKIEATGTTDGGIEIDSDGHVQLDGVQLPTAGPLSNRNLIINGAMQVAQRGTSANTGVVPDSTQTYYTCDRFGLFGIGTDNAQWTNTQSTDAPDGFRYSWKWDCTTADASPDATGRQQLSYISEGQDLDQLNWGSTSPKSITLTFWVKASQTGTNYVWLYHNDGNDFNVIDYEIQNADTWEKKILTFTGVNAPAHTSTNGRGIWLSWMLYLGSNYTSGTYQENTWLNWEASNYNMFQNQTNHASSTDNDFYITGVQLEVGDKATPFEHRSYDDELQRCQRYYQERTYLGGGIVTTGVSWSTATAACNIPTNSKMRVAPTVELPPAGSGSSVLAFLTSGGGYPTTIGTHTVSNISDTNITIYGASYAGLTDDGPSWVYAGATGGSITFKFSAEL